MDAMIKEACYELINYPRRDIKYNLKNMAKKLLKRGYMPPDYINWPNGLIALGLMEYYKKSADEEVLNCLKEYFDRWLFKGGSIYFLDDALSGEVLIYLYEKTGEQRYKEGIDKIYQYLCNALKDEEGSFVYRPSQKNKHILADMIGMVCPFLCSYSRVFIDPKASLTAYTQIENFMNNSMDPESGLPYHGYEKSKELCYGNVGWGRAVGWLMMGMSGLIYHCSDDELALTKVNKVKEDFEKLTRCVLNLQKAEGGFAWQINLSKGHTDTSATAMILASIVRAYSSKNISEEEKIRYENEFLPGIKRGYEFLQGFVSDGKVFDAEAECLGFGMYPQIYGSYPWSLGSTIYLGALL